MGKFVYDFLIDGIYLVVLLIALVRFFFKDRLSTDWTIQAVRWLMIIYSVIRFIEFLIYVFRNETLANFQMESSLDHETLYFFALLVYFAPLVLLDSRIGKKFPLLFFVGLLLNIQSIALVYFWSCLNEDFTEQVLQLIAIRTIIVVCFVFISLLLVENGLKAWIKKRMTQ
ncbi:MAG: hypothetical protein RL204_2270 [Bacteroidota bacterium]|jgi:hypothetical protein